MTHKIGEVMFAEGLIEINAGKPVTNMIVTNTGDRTIQVCSHYHFFEANRALAFDREAAFGLRLDIPAGSAIRFEPGEEKEVVLTTYAGEGNLYGFQGWTMGNIHDPQVRERALQRMRQAMGEATGSEAAAAAKHAATWEGVDAAAETEAAPAAPGNGGE